MLSKLHTLCTTIHSNYTTFCYDKIHDKNCGRWVKRAKKKVRGTFFPSNRPTRHLCRGARGPVDLAFAPTEAKTTLNPGFKGLLGIQNKKEQVIDLLSFRSACGRWDLNPHDCNSHKILSLARLPVPTLPHLVLCFKHKTYHT